PTQGVDLVSALQGRPPPPDLVQYAEARLAEEGFGMAPLSGLREHGRKFIRAPRPELYDLRADPREVDNRYPRAPRPWRHARRAAPREADTRYPADPPAAAPLEHRLAAVVQESSARALPA